MVPLPGPVHVLATASGTLNAALRVLDAGMQSRVEEALKECADDARSDVLVRLMGDRSPTPQDCNEVVSTDSRGRPITRAMLLGEEMHRVALRCVEERLSKLRPGGFSLEPRYRYDRPTRSKTLMSPEEVEALLRAGRASELLGTLVPDVVLHAGDPLHIQAVYDFKFPCVNTDTFQDWRRYPKGHPYAYESQGELYFEAFGVPPHPVLPRVGVIR